MNKDYLKNEGNALKVQKHQLNQSENKLAEIDNILSNIQSSQEQDNLLLDNMLLDMEELLGTTDNTVDSYSQGDILNIEKQLEITVDPENLAVVEELDKVDFDDNISWEEYMNSIEEYSFKNNLDLTEDPFKSLMTKSQQVELQKKIKDEFTLKNAQCDKYDYMIAGTCGVIAGLVDILFVGAPRDSKLGDIADGQANKITEKFAGFVGWKKEQVDIAYQKHIDNFQMQGKVPQSYENFKKHNMLNFLENKYKVNYDQVSTSHKNSKLGTGGAVEGLEASNHHLKSLGHSPDIIGLFFSILNQFTSTSTFISNGQIVTIDTENFNLEGHNFIAKIFCGFANWFGHLMSDWAGSKTSAKKGNRGSGAPIPFYNLLQLLNVGSFGEKEETFAQITTKVFEKGYDSRHAMAMAIPVLINELLIRFMYTMKARFYHEKEWRDCIPKGNIPEVRRMLLVGHGVLCIIDGADAYIRSGSGADMVTFLSRTNLLAWTRFGQLALKELYAWYNSGHIDVEKVDEYLDEELKMMLKKNNYEKIT